MPSLLVSCSPSPSTPWQITEAKGAVTQQGIGLQQRVPGAGPMPPACQLRVPGLRTNTATPDGESAALGKWPANTSMYVGGGGGHLPHSRGQSDLVLEFPAL